MEILQLKYFYESAREESFSKTAEKHMVPLSSVSASVKRLETELGCPLFDRHFNRIKLNENGRRLQNSLCMIFNELDNVTKALSPSENNKKEIKILVRAIRGEIADNIIEYTSLHPNISFKTIFNFTGEDIDEYDMIIDDNLDKYFGYESFEFCNKRLYLAASARSPLCNKKLKLKQLCNQPFISTGEHTSSHKMLLKSCQSEGFVPNFIIHTNDLLCYNKYVEAGIGIGVTRKDSDTSKNIKCLDVSDFVGRQSIFVFYKKQALTESVKDFLDFLKSKAV